MGDTDELGTAMKALGADSTRAELEELVKEIDEDGNGEIDFDEFCSMIQTKMAGTSVEEMHEAFKAFNKSGNGFLSAGEIRIVLEKMGEIVTEDEVVQLDLDGD